MWQSSALASSCNISLLRFQVLNPFPGLNSLCHQEQALHSRLWFKTSRHMQIELEEDVPGYRFRDVYADSQHHNKMQPGFCSPCTIVTGFSRAHIMLIHVRA